MYRNDNIIMEIACMIALRHFFSMFFINGAKGLKLKKWWKIAKNIEKHGTITYKHDEINEKSCALKQGTN